MAWRAAGIRTQAGGLQFEADKKRRDTELKSVRGKSSLQSTLSAAAAAVAPGIARSSTRGPRIKTEPQTPMTPMTPLTPVPASPMPSERKPLPIVQARRSNPLDLTTHAGYELLGEQERQICSVVRLTPLQYLHIKDKMVSENYRLGYLAKKTARAMFKIGMRFFS